jgi:tetratricopeptide (TPR) repeat protein
MRSPEIFAQASMCYKELGDYEKSVAMLDSAVNCFGSDAVKASAPYILTRALVYATDGKYRNAVFDYNKYEELMGGALGAEFYYLRVQAELSAKMYQQALNDIDTAIDLAPNNVAYYLEKGLLCYRVNLADEGIRVMTAAKELAPEMPDVQYLLGRLYMLKGDNDAARPCIEKAMQLGHPAAEATLQQLGN